MKSLEKYVNSELTKVYTWLAANQLTLNISKSKYMIISRKRTSPLLSIRINGEKLEQCDSYKYLGVYIDKDLSWKTHIEYINKKIAKACGAMSKLRHFVGISTLINVYYALVHSYIRYGIIAWGNATNSVLQSLQVLINRVVRIMSFAPLGKLDPIPIYKHLSIPNLHQTFKLESAKFVFKSKNDLLPISDIANYWVRTPSTNRPVRQTRNNGMSSIQIALLSNYAQKSIRIRGIDLWNEIPLDIRGDTTLNVFKRALKKHYILND